MMTSKNIERVLTFSNYQLGFENSMIQGALFPYGHGSGYQVDYPCTKIAHENGIIYMLLNKINVNETDLEKKYEYHIVAYNIETEESTSIFNYVGRNISETSGMVVHNGIAYITGGHFYKANSYGGSTGDGGVGCKKIDLTTGVQSDFASKPTVTHRSRAILMGDKIYYLSGNNESHDYGSTVVECYDTSSDTWEAKNMSPEIDIEDDPHYIDGSDIYFIVSASGYARSFTIYRYDTVNDIWNVHATYAFSGNSYALPPTYSFSFPNKGIWELPYVRVVPEVSFDFKMLQYNFDTGVWKELDKQSYYHDRSYVIQVGDINYFFHGMIAYPPAIGVLQNVYKLRYNATTLPEHIDILGEVKVNINKKFRWKGAEKPAGVTFAAKEKGRIELIEAGIIGKITEKIKEETITTLPL